MKSTRTIKTKNDKGERLVLSKWVRKSIYVSFKMNLDTRDSELKLIFPENRYISREERLFLNGVVRDVEDRAVKNEIETITTSMVLHDDVLRQTRETLEQMMKVRI